VKAEVGKDDGPLGDVAYLQWVLQGLKMVAVAVAEGSMQAPIRSELSSVFRAHCGQTQALDKGTIAVKIVVRYEEKCHGIGVGDFGVIEFICGYCGLGECPCSYYKDGCK
jgi:hypothetical protein